MWEPPEITFNPTGKHYGVTASFKSWDVDERKAFVGFLKTLPVQRGGLITVSSGTDSTRIATHDGTQWQDGYIKT